MLTLNTGVDRMFQIETVSKAAGYVNNLLSSLQRQLQDQIVDNDNGVTLTSNLTSHSAR